MSRDRPTAAFALSLIGGIFIIIGSLVTALVTVLFGGVLMLIPFVGGLGALIIVFGIIGLVFGIITLIGATMINSGDPSKVRTGSILVLIFSILSLLTGGGFIIGFILALIGSILGLTWKPSEKPRYESLPPPPP
ncbi:MAG: hypothetical protein NZ929_00290 [Aigarchaeota archaeon]|nr:hypothetical protein [Aigarchaeota archaeon]MCX8193152.1 hypothetical protein [Nitrososphaeria archaeon]MDW7986775.1 hypothetical protein [Nitrososphaerota archaeon]